MALRTSSFHPLARGPVDRMIRPMNGIARLGDRAAALARAVVPDPFVIAILLSLGVLLVAWVFGTGPVVTDGGLPRVFLLLEAYAGGMLETGLIAFAFQMALILVTGYALADAPPVRGALAVVAGLPKRPASAAAVVALTACLLGVLNWGLALVGGAFLAREVGRAFERRGQRLNYPLIGAAGYLGLLVWHGGLSGSAPLAVASPGAFGVAIPVSETLLSARNLATTSALVILMPALFYFLGRAPPASEEHAPEEPAPSPVDEEAEREAEEEEEEGRRFAGVLERTPLVTWCLAIPLAVAVLLALFTLGSRAITLNFIIITFLTLGLFLNGNPLQYARAFSDGARGAAGILLQFPLYFGILGVMRESGLLVSLARGFEGASIALSDVIAPDVSASWFTFLAAALINLLVPSGGGQWTLQAPVILQTAAQLNLERGPLVMAFAYGDQLTNMLQPFWALPLLSITGLKARDVFGYTMLAMAFATPVILFFLAIL